SPCGCHPVGSVSSTCDSRGRCSCKDGVMGQKCDRCSDGPIGPNGCTQSAPLPCFCHGHSSRCSAGSGYSVHPITSTFTDGPEGWGTAGVRDTGPTGVLFRWSPKHQDLEVISTSSLPAYLKAPGPYLGNQLLSYGQNLSFSLRMDHSVRQPSYNDVILEGGGLQVAASLGGLLSAAPCRQKMNYTFRLDEQPSSGWRPQLSSQQFQTLLQNLTSLRIRATFGPGRGYLDNVQMVSARRGDGSPAPWVRTCSCPLGHEGDFCERCSARFKRTNPAEGPFSSCEPCGCRGGGCDPQTGDCYSADETAAQLKCPPGFYRNRWDPESCLRCPCPGGVSCTLQDGSGQPQCDPCPLGTTGRRCDVCQEGFYGDPVGNRACRGNTPPLPPFCSVGCSGFVQSQQPGESPAVGQRSTPPLAGTKMVQVEAEKKGAGTTDEKGAACDCDPRGSVSTRCDHLGRCQCKPGFQGVRCQSSSCPACFTSIKMKMKEYTTKLEEMLLDVGRGHDGVESPEMEAALRNMEQLMDNVQLDMDKSTGLETRLQDRLSSANTTHVSNRETIQKIAEVQDDAQQRHQLYNRKVDEVQKLLEEMKQNLERAENELRSADVPSGDAPQASGFSALLQTALTLADLHQREADVVHQSSSAALNGSMKSLALVQTLMSKENKVKDVVGGLRSRHDQTSAQVKDLENQAQHLSSEAREESAAANSMLTDIAKLEQELPSDLKDDVDTMTSMLSDLAEAATRSSEDLDSLQQGVKQNKAAMENLLKEGRASGQTLEKLLGRVEAAREVTNAALQGFQGSSEDLNAALTSLKGFNQQINNYRAEADGAVRRLDAINATVQQAASSNAETQAVLRDMSEDFRRGLANANTLENLLSSAEGAFRSLPAHSHLLAEGTELKEDSEALKIRVDRAAEDLQTEMDAATRLEDDSGQAAVAAAGALDHSRRSRAAVEQTLQQINGLLAQMNQTGLVDQGRLQQMEHLLASAEREVEQRLRPWLREAELQEDAHKRHLSAVTADMDAVLADIDNLKDILASVPEGCFNTLPIEKP
uniref:Laminin, gamma 2 n=1 Tax=Tetraodon nigroviridis TaxID=99883 RepID=H3CD97_TETNG